MMLKKSLLAVLAAVALILPGVGTTPAAAATGVTAWEDPSFAPRFLAADSDGSAWWAEPYPSGKVRHILDDGTVSTWQLLDAGTPNGNAVVQGIAVTSDAVWVTGLGVLYRLPKTGPGAVPEVISGGGFKLRGAPVHTPCGIAVVADQGSTATGVWIFTGSTTQWYPILNANVGFLTSLTSLGGTLWFADADGAGWAGVGRATLPSDCSPQSLSATQFAAPYGQVSVGAGSAWTTDGGVVVRVSPDGTLLRLGIGGSYAPPIGASTITAIDGRSGVLWSGSETRLGRFDPVAGIARYYTVSGGSARRVSPAASGSVTWFADETTHTIGFVDSSSEPDLDPPHEPRTVRASPGEQSATVSWAAPASDGGAPLTGYTVTAVDSSMVERTSGAAADATSVVFPNLTPGVQYTGLDPVRRTA